MKVQHSRFSPNPRSNSLQMKHKHEFLTKFITRICHFSSSASVFSDLHSSAGATFPEVSLVPHFLHQPSSISFPNFHSANIKLQATAMQTVDVQVSAKNPPGYGFGPGSPVDALMARDVKCAEVTRNITVDINDCQKLPERAHSLCRLKFHGSKNVAKTQLPIPEYHKLIQTLVLYVSLFKLSANPFTSCLSSVLTTS